MEKFYYETDIACLTIVCGGSITYIHNGYGDGDFHFYKGEFTDNFEKENNLEFCCIAYFSNAKVLGTDLFNDGDGEPCVPNEQLIVTTLNGSYSIYHDNRGNMYLNHRN